MIDIREILVRIFSAIFLSMCTGSCMFVFWMALRKFFADKIRPKVYDLILKIILIAYYVPAGYLLVNIFFDNGYVFDFTGTIIKAFYAISLFWLAGAIATVLKFGERTFRIGREKERCFPCKMYVQKIFEDCKRELGIRRSIEVLQGYRIQIPMTAGILKPCVFLPVEDMEEEQLKTCIYHELTHYKKHDIFWNYIACLMVCIHWYCPWIRTVFRKNDEWSEVICDLSAIGYVGSAKRYFTTIFEMSQKSQGIKAYRAACLFESRDSLEQRIYYAMMYRKQKKIKYAAVIAMTVIFCGMSVTSILAASKGYQKAYTKWVQETEVEIEEPDDEEEERISYEEKTGVLGNDKSETIKKINFKKMDAMTLETYVKAGKRLRYKGLTPKRNENIEIFITSQKNFKGIKVGIIDSQNRIRYIQDRGRDLVEHRFKIEKEGKYDVFIEMEEKTMIKYIKIMVTVFTLLISCSVTNIFASDTNDVIEEKIDISENIIDEVGEEDFELLSNSITVNWTVKNGVRKKTKEFYKKKGSSINIRLQIAPKTKSVKVGYLDADKVKHYKTVKAEINHNFIIQKTGYIEVFVENSSGKTVTASGTYTK